MKAKATWLSELVWQIATIAAVPAVVGLAIAFANSARPSYPATFGDHAHSEPHCAYCIASRESGLAAVSAPVARDPRVGTETTRGPAH